MTTATPSAPSRFTGLGSSRLTLAIIIVCLLGIADAGYLTYVHYAGIKVLCVGGHGGTSSCQTVQASQWSKLDGIPVALLGLIGYVVMLATLFVPGDFGRVATFGVALMGFGFSMYLTYREIFTIKAICEWCVGSAVFMTVLVVLTAWRFIQSE